MAGLKVQMCELSRGPCSVQISNLTDSVYWLIHTRWACNSRQFNTKTLQFGLTSALKTFTYPGNLAIDKFQYLTPVTALESLWQASQRKMAPIDISSSLSDTLEPQFDIE